MLIKKLYTYQVTELGENQISALLDFNAYHPLYQGHFPGFPVTPGVCQLLFIREILEKVLQLKLMLASAKQIKFTAVHDPASEPSIEALINYKHADNQLMVTASLKKNEKVFIKFKGEFRKQK